MGTGLGRLEQNRPAKEITVRCAYALRALVHNFGKELHVWEQLRCNLNMMYEAWL